MDEKQLIEELKKFGWREVYYGGNGDTCPVTEGEYVVGDIEKKIILVPPNCIWEEPQTVESYFGF